MVKPQHPQINNHLLLKHSHGVATNLNRWSAIRWFANSDRRLNDKKMKKRLYSVKG